MNTKILMIEQDTDDRQLTEETFRAEGLVDGVHFIHGDLALAYLNHPNNHPPLIIVSLDLTLAGGPAMIRQIRELPMYEKVPIVALGESALPSAVKTCYAAGATSYIQKPATYSEALFKIKTFINYWLRTVELPA